MKAARTHTQLMAAQKLGKRCLALNQIPLHESNLRYTQLIDSQELLSYLFPKLVQNYSCVPKLNIIDI